MRPSIARTSSWVAWTLAILLCPAAAEDASAAAVQVSEGTPASPVTEGEQANHRDPTICVDGAGGLYVGYIDIGANVSTFKALASADAGATFGEAVALTQSSDQPSVQPANRSRSVAFEGGGVVFAWYDQGVATGDIDLICATSSDGGATFEKRRQVESDRQDVGQCGADLVVIEGDRLLAAWIDLRGGPKHPGIHASVSADRGLTWSPLEAPWFSDVSAGGGIRLLLDPKEKLYAVFRVPGEKESHDPMWAKIEVRRKGGIDPQAGKEVMRRPKRVREEPESPPAGVAISKSGDVGCLWRTGDDRAPRIVFALSKNRGAMWRPAVDLPIEDDSEPEFPQLALLPGGDLLAAWEGVHDRNEAVFLSRSSDGETWSKPQVIERASSLAIAGKVVEKRLPIAYRSEQDQRIHVAFLK